MKMFRGRFLGAILALLLIIGLFGLAGSSIYRAGWTQGYFVGKASDGATVVGPGEGVPSEAAPNASTPYYGPGRAFGPSPFLGFFGAIFKFFLFFMVLGLIFKLFFGLLFWRKRGRWGKYWHRDRGCHHGHQQPPWYEEGIGDEPVMKA
jgi:hypothetical protein